VASKPTISPKLFTDADQILREASSVEVVSSCKRQVPRSFLLDCRC
jgi:hypothetical protein